MYPIGFLFGLGFDTASEVALLAISAGAASQALPVAAVISLPVIFAAGMSLMDTTDGAFMSKAYAWAFSNPIRKVYYNMTVTGLSVFVALFVGGVELIQILVQATHATGAPWSTISNLDFSVMGVIIVAAFFVTWVGALAIFKLRRIEERWNAYVEDIA
jgi:high-affinity nickel-transport protein